MGWREDSDDWSTQLQKFVDHRESNGKSTEGMFESSASKQAFSEQVAGRLASPSVLELQVARMLLCDRDGTTDSLGTQQSLSSYAKAAGGEAGKEVREEALKCLNNALYDHSERQKLFCAIQPSSDGFKALETVLCTEDLDLFHRCCFVCMYIAAGGQEVAESNISKSFAQACIQNLLKICEPFLTTSNNGKKNKDVVNGEALFADSAKAVRQALSSGLRLIYAVQATHQTAMEQLLLESTQLAANMLQESDNSSASVDEVLAAMRISDDKYPALDRFGLLLIALLECRDKPNTESSESSMDELKEQVVPVLMLAFTLEGLADFLVEHGATKAVLDLLESRVQRITDQEPTHKTILLFKQLLPIVIAANNLAQSSEVAKEEMRARVFAERLASPDLSTMSEKEAEAAMNDWKMRGSTSPESFGGRLISFLTCLESNLKRYTGELLYTLCNQNAGEMTLMCGYGPSAHILAIKGGTIGGIIAQQEEQERRRKEKETGNE